MDSYEIVDTELFKIKMFLQLTATIWRPHDAVSRQVVVLSWENIFIFQFSLSIFELVTQKGEIILFPRKNLLIFDTSTSCLLSQVSV